MLQLKLYVTGCTPGSERLIDELEELLAHYYDNDYELRVVDIFDHPEEAYEDVVYATPTLIKHLPPPVTRIIGDLGNRERVLAGLRLSREQSAS